MGFADMLLLLADPGRAGLPWTTSSSWTSLSCSDQVGKAFGSAVDGPRPAKGNSVITIWRPRLAPNRIAELPGVREYRFQKLLRRWGKD
jgi:hypothetical protein